MTMDSQSGVPSGFTGHPFVYNTLFNFIPADQPFKIALNEFLGSPMSGVLLGLLSPFLAPWVALGNSIGDGDSFAEILANTVGAFFNGATLNADAAIPLLVNSGLLVLPPDTTINHLDLALGGSMFNSLGLDITAAGSHFVTEGHPVGPLAAWQGLSEVLGLQLGDNWNGKIPGGFAKLPAHPPGVGLPSPTIPDLPTSDAGDTAAVAGQFDVSDVFNDFVNGASNWLSF